MRTLVILTLAVLAFGFWITTEQNSSTGKNPDDEVVTRCQESNKVTGELLTVETIKCRLCGDVISYRQTNLKGKLIYAYSSSHQCRASLVRYQPMDMDSAESNVIGWLSGWQHKLRLRR